MIRKNRVLYLLLKALFPLQLAYHKEIISILKPWCLEIDDGENYILLIVPLIFFIRIKSNELKEAIRA